MLTNMTRYEEVREHLNNNQYTWLITGVAGFIGSNLVDKLIEQGVEVTILDDLSTGKKENINPKA